MKIYFLFLYTIELLYVYFLVDIIYNKTNFSK